MANPQIAITPRPFTLEVNTKQARTKAIIRFFRFRPIGRVLRIIKSQDSSSLGLTILSLLRGVQRELMKAGRPEGARWNLNPLFNVFIYAYRSATNQVL
jgi:hypothetical protein